MVAAPSLSSRGDAGPIVELAALFVIQRVGTHAVGVSSGRRSWPGSRRSRPPASGGSWPTGDRQGALAQLRRRVRRLLIPGLPSSRSPRSCSRSLAPRRCTPTWVTSAAAVDQPRLVPRRLPGATLDSMGQGSLILGTPTAIDNPFFSWFRIGDASDGAARHCGAAVIASQAVISGAFWVTRQAVQLGFLPRLSIRHTSAREIGQVYAPAVVGPCRRGDRASFWARLIGTMLSFGLRDRGDWHDHGRHHPLSRGRRALWRKPTWMVAGGALVFLTVDFAFLGANVPVVRRRRLDPARDRSRRLPHPQHADARSRCRPGPSRGQRGAAAGLRA